MNTELSPLALSVVAGSVYEHYKQKRYKVLGVVRHSETLEEMILYQALYGTFGTWVRPLGMFFEQVIIEGKSVPRFKLIE